MKARVHSAAALIAIAGLVVGAGQARAAGFGINEHSARAMGMANAYTAVADSPGTMFFNPAGIAQLEGLQLEAGVTMIAPLTSYTGNIPGTSTEVTFDTQLVSEEGPAFLPNIYASYRIHELVAAGVGFYAPYGLTVLWPESTSANGQDVSWWGRGIVQRIALETIFLNPTVAVKVHDRVYVGAGVNVIKSAVTLDRRVTLSSSLEDDIDVKLSADTWGVGATAGVLIKVLPDLLNVGINYRSAAKLSFEGSAGFTKDGSVDNIATGLRTRLVDDNVEGELTLPHVIGFGIAAFPLDDLTVGFNFEVTTWSTYDELAFDFENNPELSSSEPKNWENAITVRVGAEYRLLPALALRAGFIFDQSPVPQASLGPELPDGDRYEFTLGGGYEFLDFRVDLAYQFLTTGELETIDASPLQGTYTAAAHLVGLSLGYKLDI